MASYQNSKVGLLSIFFSFFFYEKIHFTFRYYLDTLNDPFVMDDPSCARITEKAYAYFKLPYQEKVRILPKKGLLNIYNIYIYAKKCQINRDILQCKKNDFKVAYWKERSRPSRWPKLLAALSYAEKLIEVCACLQI